MEKNMKRFIIYLFMFLVFLTGCSNDEAYNNALKKGKDYITNEKYQKAEASLELALDEKVDDEQATALLNQTISYQELTKHFNEGNFDQAIENADDVIQIKNGSANLVRRSKDVLEMIEELEETLAIETERYEEALRHFDSNEYDKANKQIKDILTENIEHPIFDSLRENVEKLSVDIESVLQAKQKEKEAEEKEKRERETEKKEKSDTITTYEYGSKAKNEVKSQSTYQTEKKKKYGSDWKPRDEYEAEMKKRNEEREKSRKAYEAEMKQRNADRERRNRERNY